MIKDLFTRLKKHPKRLNHVITVAQVSKSLAIKYNIDPEEAFLAGLLHDYAKYNSEVFFDKYISRKEKAKYDKYYENFHAVGAANYFKKKYSINENIYNAIYYHVYGRENMEMLEKIIFVADSIYLNGPNNSRNIYKTALENLDDAVILALEMTFADLEARNLSANKFQLKTYNYYKRR